MTYVLLARSAGNMCRVFGTNTVMSWINLTVAWWGVEWNALLCPSCPHALHLLQRLMCPLSDEVVENWPRPMIGVDAMGVGHGRGDGESRLRLLSTETWETCLLRGVDTNGDKRGRMWHWMRAMTLPPSRSASVQPVSFFRSWSVVSQSEVLGRFYNPNTTPKDKEWVVVCLRGTGQKLHYRGYYTKGIDAAKEQRFL